MTVSSTLKIHDKTLFLLTLTITFFFGSVFAQSVFIKPFAMWYRPNLGNVKANIDDDLNQFRSTTGLSIPNNDRFNSKVIFGGEVEYHLSEDFFATVFISFYEDEVLTEASSVDKTTSVFFYSRDLSTIDVKLNLQKYFHYSSWRRMNYYFGVGVGINQLDAGSKTTFTDGGVEVINTTGEFAGSILSASGYLGLTLKVIDYFKIYGEAGYMVADFGQLDGKVRTIDNPQGITTLTESSFDLSGFFLRAGVGIALPFLK